MLDSFDFIKVKQLAWAKRKGFKPVGRSIFDLGEKNYLQNLSDNLFMPLLNEKKDHYLLANKRGTKDSELRVAELKCLHSSSAFAFNLFQYWRKKKDIRPLLIALRQIRKDNRSNFKCEAMEFEKYFKITKNKSKFRLFQNIDVFISISNFGKLAVESRFCEPYYTGDPEGFPISYIKEASLWKNLPNLYEVSKKISPNNHIYHYFNATQSIKHILALVKNYKKKDLHVLYLWYDVPGENGINHRKEVDQFVRIAKKDNVLFRQITYQGVIKKLMKDYYEGNEDYLNYITDRYL